MKSVTSIVIRNESARKFARRLGREKGKKVLDTFVYSAFGRRGWMVPNQYWTPGILSPMPIIGKYDMYYRSDFVPPRLLGRKNAERFQAELILDNLGICRFHRGWAEDMVSEIIESLCGMKEQFLSNIAMTASRINSRNASVFWESERCFDYVYTFLKRKQTVENDTGAELAQWVTKLENNKLEAALDFWYEIHKGIHESLREF